MPWTHTLVSPLSSPNLLDALVDSRDAIVPEAPATSDTIWWGPWNVESAGKIGIATDSTLASLSITALSDVDDDGAIAVWETRELELEPDDASGVKESLLDDEIAEARDALSRVADVSAATLASFDADLAEQLSFRLETTATRTAMCTTRKGRALHCSEVVVLVRPFLGPDRVVCECVCTVRVCVFLFFIVHYD